MEEHKKIVEEIEQLFKKNKIKDKETWIYILGQYYTLLDEIFDNGSDEDKIYACRKGIIFLLPKLEKGLKNSGKLTDTEFSELGELYFKTFAFVSRRSFHHFLLFMEQDKTESNKVYQNRMRVLEPFAYFLNKSLFSENDKQKYIMVSFPPSYGKSFMVNYFSAFVYGVDFNASILRMSYGEELVLSASKQVKKIISDPLYSKIFPNFARLKGKIFEKNKDSDWQIMGADVAMSHLARTRDGAVTGIRANRYIILDDMTKGAIEAHDVGIHEKCYNQWSSEWRNRKDGDRTKYIIVGTMWNPQDIINRIIKDIEKDYQFYPSERFKYVKKTSDEYAIKMQVPLLDETEKCTLPNVFSLTECLKIRRDTDPFLWSAVYQQDPIAPSGLEFNYKKIATYENLNENNLDNGSYAVLDPSRKGRDNIAMPIYKYDSKTLKYYLIDCIFKQVAMTEIYDEIIEKIIEHKIIKLVVEINTDTSLVSLLNEKLVQRGIFWCEIVEKYNTKNKEQRIKDARGIAINKTVYPKEHLHGRNTDMGRFMRNFTSYSFDIPNKFDDAPDSVAMFVNEIILGDENFNNFSPLFRIRDFI